MDENGPDCARERLLREQDQRRNDRVRATLDKCSARTEAAIEAEKLAQLTLNLIVGIKRIDPDLAAMICRSELDKFSPFISTDSYPNLREVLQELSEIVRAVEQAKNDSVGLV